MKFIRGFLLGAIVGFAVGTSLSERQREEIAQRARAAARRNVKPVAESVGDNATAVADTAVDRVTSAIDGAGDAAVRAVDADPSPNAAN
jgi:gas vesicle protein